MTLTERKIKRIQSLLPHIIVGISKNFEEDYDKANWLYWFIKSNMDDVDREDLQDAINRRAKSNSNEYTKAGH